MGYGIILKFTNILRFLEYFKFKKNIIYNKISKRKPRIPRIIYLKYILGATQQTNFI